jgi:dissimilatory sulfite reductase (desulfoviridin) alpha/beta subunit
MAEDGKDPQNTPFEEAADETLELDLPPGELESASRPINPRPSRDSTLTMGDVPISPGAGINTAVTLEPLLAGLAEPLEENEPRALPPPFFSRLGRGLSQEGSEKSAAKREGPLSWSVTAGGAWPVYVRRVGPGRPARAAGLIEAARAAGRWGSGRLCLSPEGGLDIFFNDRESLQKASEHLGGSDPAAQGGPVAVSLCRGLLLCPLAAIDTFAAEKELLSALKERRVRPARPPIRVSIFGCPSGGGPGCGAEPFPDFSLTGARDRPPLISHDILALSPRLGELAAKCLGGALRQTGSPSRPLALDRGKCLRCGLCVSLDPSFFWPEPQGAYMRLGLSGRRRRLAEGAFIKPRELAPRIRENARAVFLRLADFAALYQKERAPGEIPADFVERAGLGDFFRGL